jgi:hypothetical protein
MNYSGKPIEFLIPTSLFAVYNTRMQAIHEHFSKHLSLGANSSGNEHQGELERGNNEKKQQLSKNIDTTVLQ